VKVNEDEFCNVDIGDTRSFTSMMINKDDINVVDNIHATRNDHNEGISHLLRWF